MKSKDIYLSQVALNHLGFPCGAEDGIDGPKTRKARKEWENSLKGSHVDPEAPDDVFKDVFKRTPHQSGTITPKFIVLHSSYGSFSSGVNWILDPDSKVSYHYIIRPDTGHRVQFVKDNKKAWHAGRSKYDGYSGLNAYSVGIAFTGSASRRASDVEVRSCAFKCVELMGEFNIPIESIVTHQMIAPKRKNDCSKETWGRVINMVKDILES